MAVADDRGCVWGTGRKKKNELRNEHACSGTWTVDPVEERDMPNFPVQAAAAADADGAGVEVSWNQSNH